MVDAHSELMTQYPWGFGGTVPNASDNAQDRGAFARRRLVFRDTGQLPGESRNHSYTAIVGSDRDPVGGSDGRRATTARSAQGRRCAADQTPAPMPSECDDGPFGRGTGGRLRYEVKVRGGRSTTLWIAVAGSENSARGGAQRVPPADRRPRAACSPRSSARAARSRAGPSSTCRATGCLQDSIDWGKQNLADLTQRATDLDIRWTDQGQEWTSEGSVAGMRWVGAGFPDYPWLFGVDGEYTAHAASRSGSSSRSRTTCARCARSPTSSATARASSCTRWSPTARSGYGKDPQRTDPDGRRHYDFNTDEIVKFPGAVALIWRWTGDDRFRDEMLDFTRRNLEYVRTQARRRTATAGRRATATSSGPAWARRSSTTPSTTSAACTTSPTWRGRPARRRARTRPRRAPTRWPRASRTPGGSRPSSSTRTRCGDPGDVKVNQKHWIGVDPMEVELYRDGEFEPGLAAFEQRLARARDARERLLQRRAARATAGCSTPAAAAGRPAPASSRIFSLNTGVQAVGEGNYGRLGPGQQRRYTDANAETQFSRAGDRRHARRAAGRDAGDHALARSRRAGRLGTPPNIDRCWTCRSMFMQSWGHYGTAWAVVHQQLGVRPHLGHDWLEVVPQVPDGQTSVEGEDIRLGGGSADVVATHDGHALHDDHRHARGPAEDVPHRPHAAARRDGRRRSSSTARR